MFFFFKLKNKKIQLDKIFNASTNVLSFIYSHYLTACSNICLFSNAIVKIKLCKIHSCERNSSPIIQKYPELSFTSTRTYENIMIGYRYDPIPTIQKMHRNHKILQET